MFQQKHHHIANRFRRIRLRRIRRTTVQISINLLIPWVDVWIHVAFCSKLAAGRIRFGNFCIRAEVIASSIVSPLDERTMNVDKVLNAQTDINELLDFGYAEPIHVAANAVSVVRHFVNHLAICLAEPLVALKEIAVTVNVCDHHFVIGHAVAGKQIRVTWIIVDDQLVNLLKTVGISFGQLLVLHSETPMRIPSRKSAVRGYGIQLVDIDHFENCWKVVQTVGVRMGLHFNLHVDQFLRQRL